MPSIANVRAALVADAARFVTSREIAQAVQTAGRLATEILSAASVAAPLAAPHHHVPEAPCRN